MNQLLLADAALDVGLFAEPHFCTAGLDAADQFDAWRSFHGQVIDLIPSAGSRAGFDAEIASWRLGEVVLTRAVLSGAPARRWRHRPKSFLDHWCVVLARTPSQNGGPPREEISFRSLALPFEGRARDSEVVTLYLPRNLGRAEEQAFDEAHGREVDPAFAPLLAGFMKGLVRQMPHVPAGQGRRLEAATQALVAGCILPRAAREEAAKAPLASVLIERVRQVVRQNMAAPEFGPEQLARLLAMSRSKLYRLLESHGGVAHFINRERLREAHRRLASRGGAASIHIIGNEVGFVDHSTFSRAFRREFGYSPTEARGMEARGVVSHEARALPRMG